MPDREKVIKAIEACMYQNHPACCNECYLDGPGFGIACREKLMRDAIALLREQEPVKPYRGDRWPKDTYCCGHCAQALVDTGENNRPKYCPQCGRKVKWDADGA